MKTYLMLINKVFFIFCFIYNGLSKADQVCILVHGTWGSASEWHQPSGNFYKTLENSFNKLNTKLVDFSWCGSLSYEKREIAAARLVNLINSYSNTTKIILVAHSHGSNVGIIASQTIKAKSKISSHLAIHAKPHSDCTNAPCP